MYPEINDNIIKHNTCWNEGVVIILVVALLCFFSFYWVFPFLQHGQLNLWRIHCIRIVQIIGSIESIYQYLHDIHDQIHLVNWYLLHFLIKARQFQDISVLFCDLKELYILQYGEIWSNLFRLVLEHLIINQPINTWYTYVMVWYLT